MYAVGIPDDPHLAETFYEQDEFASDSDGDDDMQSMCSNLQSVLFDATCEYYLPDSSCFLNIVYITRCRVKLNVSPPGCATSHYEQNSVLKIKPAKIGCRVNILRWIEKLVTDYSSPTLKIGQRSVQ